MHSKLETQQKFPDFQECCINVTLIFVYLPDRVPFSVLFENISEILFHNVNLKVFV